MKIVWFSHSKILFLLEKTVLHKKYFYLLWYFAKATYLVKSSSWIQRKQYQATEKKAQCIMKCITAQLYIEIFIDAHLHKYYNKIYHSTILDYIII